MAKISVLKLYSTVPKYLHVSKHETSAPAFFCVLCSCLKSIVSVDDVVCVVLVCIVFFYVRFNSSLTRYR